LRILEDGNMKKLSGTGKVKAKFEKYQSKSEVKLYPTEDDNTIPIVMEKKRKHSEGKPLIEEIEAEAGTSEPPKKKKKKGKQESSEDNGQAEEEVAEETPKKKKKSKKDESMVVEEPEVEPTNSEKKKKKKKNKQESDE
jgi:hypothetical protein